VFYLALQLVACDTGSFQARLHEHGQSIAPSPVCNSSLSASVVRMYGYLPPERQMGLHSGA